MPRSLRPTRPPWVELGHELELLMQSGRSLGLPWPLFTCFSTQLPPALQSLDTQHGHVFPQHSLSTRHSRAQIWNQTEWFCLSFPTCELCDLG